MKARTQVIVTVNTINKNSLPLSNLFVGPEHVCGTMPGHGFKSKRDAPGSSGSTLFSACGRNVSVYFLQRSEGRCSCRSRFPAWQGWVPPEGLGVEWEHLICPVIKPRGTHWFFCRIINSLEGKNLSPDYHCVDWGTWERRQGKTTAEDYGSLRKGRTGDERRPPCPKTLVALPPCSWGSQPFVCQTWIHPHSHIPSVGVYAC